MDPNVTLHLIRVELASHREHGDADVEALTEHVQALDDWLMNGGFLPRPWRSNATPRVNDTTHPRELPNPADEAAFFDRRKRAVHAGLEAIERELNSHPTWQTRVRRSAEEA